MTMSSNNKTKTGSSKLANLALVLVLTVIWCFVFLLVFIICYLLKTRRREVTHSGSHVSFNEVSEKTRKQENHKTYKERVNSVYYEWFRDHSEQRTLNNSVLYEMEDMS